MKIKYFIISIIASVVLYSCNKADDFNYPEGTVGISKITNFPTLSLKGAEYIAIAVGGTFTEPGVVAQEGGKDIAFTTVGSVNTAIVGVYLITYTALNKDGFNASVKRWVTIYSTDATAAAHDLSGTYLRSSNGATNSWSKLAPGVYKVINPGGALGATLTVVIFNQTGYIVKIPSQTSNDGNTTSSSTETFTAGTPDKYSMIILNPGYGTGLRSFVKQ